jgi:hypothetical protein
MWRRTARAAELPRWLQKPKCCYEANWKNQASRPARVDVDVRMRMFCMD